MGHLGSRYIIDVIIIREYIGMYAQTLVLKPCFGLFIFPPVLSISWGPAPKDPGNNKCNMIFVVVLTQGWISTTRHLIKSNPRWCGHRFYPRSGVFFSAYFDLISWLNLAHSPRRSTPLFEHRGRLPASWEAIWSGLSLDKIKSLQTTDTSCRCH